MSRFPVAVLGVSLGSALMLLPLGAQAIHADRTVCTRQFVTLPAPSSDPFGYRYTEPLTIPGIGRKRRIAECDYLAAGDTDDRGRGRGEGEGERGLRVRGPQIDYARYIADLLRERERARPKRKGEPVVTGPVSPEDDLDHPYDQDGVPPIDALDPHNDADCDGFTNSEELFLGTDPLDAQDPKVAAGVRRRTVSLDPRHPCYAGIGDVVMPKTGWDRGAWFFLEELPPQRFPTVSRMMIVLSTIGALSFLALLLVRGRGRG